jgi:hypothetical protein
MVRAAAFEFQEALGGFRIAVHEYAGQQIGEEADTVHATDQDRTTVQEPAQGLLVEPSWQGVGLTATTVGVVQQPTCFVESTGNGPGQDRSESVGDEQAEESSGPDHVDGVLHRQARIVDVLECPVADDEIGGMPPHHPEQGPGVALLRPDPLRDPGLSGAALESGESVGTGVDNGDPMPEDGQGDGEAAGPATHVDDVESGAGQGVATFDDEGVQGIPDHGGPDRGPGVVALCPVVGPGVGVRHDDLPAA